MPKGSRNPDPIYGVSAAENKWVVTLRRNRERFQMSFSHITYGGSDAALAAAQAWRDETVRLHPPSRKRERAQQIISTNKSGVPGVRCRLGPDGQPQLWMVQTRMGDKVLRKSFSAGRYGDRARLLAIAERQKHLDLIEGRASRHPADQVEPDRPPVSPERWLTKPVARAEVVRRNNKSGIAGVQLQIGYAGQPRAWVARTRIGSDEVRKVFLISEHGEERAKALAVAERQAQIARQLSTRHTSKQFAGPTSC